MEAAPASLTASIVVNRNIRWSLMDIGCGSSRPATLIGALLDTSWMMYTLSPRTGSMSSAFSSPLAKRVYFTLIVKSGQ